MATTTTVPQTELPRLDWTIVENKFKSLQLYLKTFLGQKKHNPALYYRHNIQPLELRYKLAKQSGKGLTPELYNEILALKEVVPIVTGEASTIPEQIFDTVLTTPVDVNTHLMKQVTS